MAYKHLYQSDRDRIEALLGAGHLPAEIARVLKVHKSTISREVKRRKRRDGRYDADTAQHKAYVKRKYSKYQGMKVEEHSELKARIIRELKLKRSPDEIAGRLNREAGRGIVNHKAIYAWMYSVYGERYCRYLCTRRKRKKHQNAETQKRVMIQNLVSIHAVSPGCIHAEGDTFVSPRKYHTTASVAVVVDRASKLIVAQKIPNLKPRIMARAVRSFQRRVVIPNVLLDRGIENRCHAQFGIPTYFCDAHSPWQKPLVEGSIGLLRRWFWKKGTNLAEVRNREIQRGIMIINNKYRKSPGYQSACEVARERAILKESFNPQSCA